MKKYPEWQKAIREAQVRDQAKCDEMDAEEYENAAMLLEALGLPRGKQEGACARLGNYTFGQFWVPAGSPGEEQEEWLSISRVGLFAADFTGDFENTHVGDLDDEENKEATLMEIAYILDRLDRNYRWAFFRLFNRKYAGRILAAWKDAIVGKFA